MTHPSPSVPLTLKTEKDGYAESLKQVGGEGEKQVRVELLLRHLRGERWKLPDEEKTQLPPPKSFLVFR